jgi:hypothetical protein
VKLGKGVGLREAQGLDDYEDAATRARYRASDEKEDWSRIPAEELNRSYSSLSFFDAEGMRFHLPAYLIAELQGLYGQDLVFHLTYPSSLTDGTFALLSPAQRSAVRAYLLHIAASPDHRLSRADKRALDGYWADPPRPKVTAAHNKGAPAKRGWR